MQHWERRARLKIEEAAEVRRFVEAQARKTEADTSLRRAENDHLKLETQVKQIDRKNNATDNFLMEVARQRLERTRSHTRHIQEVLGKGME